MREPHWPDLSRRVAEAAGISAVDARCKCGHEDHKHLIGSTSACYSWCPCERFDADPTYTTYPNLATWQGAGLLIDALEAKGYTRFIFERNDKGTYDCDIQHGDVGEDAWTYEQPSKLHALLLAAAQALGVPVDGEVRT